MLLALSRGLTHVSIVATLGASTWIDILEALKFKFLLLLNWCIPVGNGLIGMNLRICLSHFNEIASILRLGCLKLS